MNLNAVRRMAERCPLRGLHPVPVPRLGPEEPEPLAIGVVMPSAYTAADPSESAVTQTECVLEHSGQPTIQIILRFLQVQRRTVEGSPAAAWDEAVEREIEFTVDRAELLGEGCVKDFAVAGGEDREPLADGGDPQDGPGTGDTIRRREPLAGAVSVRALPIAGPWQAVRLRIRVENLSMADPVPQHREEALPWALVAAHMIISVSGGEFISMTDPPIWARAAVAECENIGGWPVLGDPDGGRQVMLSAPIILYDNPELAPESPGELYDGTEIDEILTLRTLALSDDEKIEARATDPRAAALDRPGRVDGRADHGRAARHHAPGAARIPRGSGGSDPRPGRPLVGSGGRRLGVPGHRRRDHRRPADRARQPSPAAAGDPSQRRPGHVPDRADRRGPGGAV